MHVDWLPITCPGCGSHEEPVRNDDPRTKKLNPYQCTRCKRVGSGEDFNLFPVLEDE